MQLEQHAETVPSGARDDVELPQRTAPRQRPDYQLGGQGRDPVQVARTVEAVHLDVILRAERRIIGPCPRQEGNPRRLHAKAQLGDTLGPLRQNSGNPRRITEPFRPEDRQRAEVHR